MSATIPRAMSGQIVFGDNLTYLRTVPDGSIDLIYIDPPFNTGHKQVRKQLRTVRDDKAPDRKGFKGNSYKTELLGQKSFEDEFEDFEKFIVPRLEQAHRVLKPNGSLFLHLDYREVHRCKLRLDEIFGRPECFINEIIWAYDYGARSKSRWSPKHDNILWYAKNPPHYTFNYDAIDRIPYMAPGLVGPEKAAKGKTPTDMWWNTIVSPTGKEKTGYPTQKPLAIIERIVKIHSNPGDTVLDFFAGSGTLGEACAKLGRTYVLVDSSREAVAIIKRRLERFKPLVTDVARIDSELRATRAAAAKAIESAATNVNAVRISDAIPRVHIIAAAVWEYDDPMLQRLRGPESDLKMIRRLFGDSPTGVYGEDQIRLLRNPTGEDLRSAIVKYAYNSSTTGNILIFYFSGHGTVLANNDFGLCVRDTRTRQRGGCLPLSAVSFGDIVRTLIAADIIPVLIIDSCFSGKAGQIDQNRAMTAMYHDVHQVAGGSYALFAGCYGESEALDPAAGGVFTKALLDAAISGRSDSTFRRKEFLELKDLLLPVQANMTLVEGGLPKPFVAPDLVPFPFVRNVAYKPVREN